MNTVLKNFFGVTSNKAEEIKTFFSELCAVAMNVRDSFSNICFASENGKKHKNFTKANMTEFGTISAPIPDTAFGFGFAERRRRRILRDEHIKKLAELKEHIEYAKSEMDYAVSNFNNVTEPKLIDYYIYKLQSEQNRYEQLLSEYKQLSESR